MDITRFEKELNGQGLPQRYSVPNYYVSAIPPQIIDKNISFFDIISVNSNFTLLHQ